MAISTAISVASFSAVLAQSFVAVAASTLIPATFVSALRAIKGSLGPDGAETSETQTAADKLEKLLEGAPGTGNILEALRKGAATVGDIDLLVPKTARITGEFTFEATERYSAEVGLSGAVNVISVAAAYSALYETRSTNKITLEVDFAAVNYTL